MAAKGVVGRCHICGLFRPLTAEHIPPRGAGNKRTVFELHSNTELMAIPAEAIGRRVVQGGHHRFTLCSECNSKTGAWYGRAFGEWSIQGMEALTQTGGNPKTIVVSSGYPLRIVKQVISMFLSINPIELRDSNRDLADFVRNKESIGLPLGFRLFGYYTSSPVLRFSPFCTMGNAQTGVEHAMSEISFPPFGFLMTYKTGPTSDRLADLTHFARYSYKETATLDIPATVLPVVTFLPGDYRREEEIGIEPKPIDAPDYNGQDIVDGVDRMKTLMSDLLGS